MLFSIFILVIPLTYIYTNALALYCIDVNIDKDSPYLNLYGTLLLVIM